jgi:hypothetical protein
MTEEIKPEIKVKKPSVKRSTYADGRIFKLIDNTNGNVFIGGTIRNLCQRVANFKSKYRSYLKNSTNKYLLEFEIIKNNNYSIELVEMCPCNNKDELNKQIYKHIAINECINKIKHVVSRVNDINYANEFDIIFSNIDSKINNDIDCEKIINIEIPNEPNIINSFDI